MHLAKRPQVQSLALTTLALVSLQPPALADIESDALRIHLAPAPGDFGTRVAALGDVDADGINDYSVSDAGLGLGYVAIYSGATGNHLRSIAGGHATDLFGYAVIDLGDIDQDGIDDLAISAPTTNVDFKYQFAGVVTAFSGATAQVIWTLRGESQSELLGFSMTNVEDLDNDGMMDLVVGCPGWRAGTVSTPIGRVLKVSGATGAVIDQWEAGSQRQAGHAVARLDDLDGDGVSEICVGCSESSEVLILRGMQFTPLRSTAGQPSSMFGWSVAAIGDVDGDGLGDLVVGAPHHHLNGPNVGRAAAYSSATMELLWEATGTPLSGLVGRSVDRGPDIDQDGDDDVLVGAPGSLGGRVLGFELENGHRLADIRGAPGAPSIADSLARIDDVNGDGTADILIGAWGGPATRRAYVVTGRYDPMDPSGVFEISSNAAAGSATPGSLRSGDLNGDGASDVAVVDAAGNRVLVSSVSEDGLLSAPVSLKVGKRPSDLALVDLDLDDDLDLVVALRGETALAIYRNDDGELRKSGKVDVKGHPVAIAVGHFAGDHVPDIAVAFAHGNSLSILKNSVAGFGPLARRFRLEAEVAISFEPTHLFATRMDSSGQRDLLAVSSITGQAAAFINRGDFRFTPERVTDLQAANLPLTGVVIGDFDGDGTRDIATCNNVATSVAIHSGRGNGTFRPPENSPAAPGPVRSLACADLDGNGVSDLICGDVQGSSVTAVLMPGEDSEDEPFVHSIVTEARPRWLVSGDTDGDADADAVVLDSDGTCTHLRNIWLQH